MTGKIQLHSKTIELLKEYLDLIQREQLSIEIVGSSVNLEQLIQWISIEIPDEVYFQPLFKDKFEFTLSAFQAKLLEDLANSIVSPLGSVTKQEVVPTTIDKLKFAILAVSGTTLSASEGLDSITTMAEILPFSALVILAIGFVFSALSIMRFYGVDLVPVAQNWGINFENAPTLLDYLVLQKKEINKICQKISYLHLAELSIEELKCLEELIAALQLRIKGIAKASKPFTDALDAFSVRVTKTIIAICSGGMFFGTGYFAGQSVALYLFSFFIGTVVSTSLPVVGISTVVGLTGFALYWYTQKVGLDKLVSSWMGLDEEKIDQISNASLIQEQADKLENLKLQINSTSLLIAQINSLRTASEGTTHQQVKTEMNKDAVIHSQPTISFGSNIYAFHHVNAVKRGSEDCVVALPELDCCVM
ncbi:hypothetical protein [Legionella waltersii]|uniref:Coiled-coil protein n=1 Tax=Legionella waltersii TaxID=66969 RepID=A0A0W1A4Q1_9GAMM|nr:hypothetical protein [Legionella waltersii]KTD76294.1 coiled-coil protein [Legionella waltersii]SNV13494.1 coiled-coil protein [Legionella waltersii]